MRTFRYILIVGLLVALYPSASAAESGSLMGLWKVEEIVDLDAGTTKKQREFHVFTQSHHMIVLAGENRRKIKKSVSDMTADEVASQQPIGAGFYKYEVKGDKLLRTNIVALSAYYEGKSFETEFKVEGDRLTLRDRHAADGHLREWRLRRVE